MKIHATFLALALAGCATVETGGQTWYREGGTADEQSAALGAAEVQAKQAHVLQAEERVIASRVIVRKATKTAEPEAVTTKKTTTTTTTKE